MKIKFRIVRGTPSKNNSQQLSRKFVSLKAAKEVMSDYYGSAGVPMPVEIIRSTQLNSDSVFGFRWRGIKRNEYITVLALYNETEDAYVILPAIKEIPLSENAVISEIALTGLEDDHPVQIYSPVGDVHKAQIRAIASVVTTPTTPDDIVIPGDVPGRETLMRPIALG